MPAPSGNRLVMSLVYVLSLVPNPAPTTYDENCSSYEHCNSRHVWRLFHLAGLRRFWRPPGFLYCTLQAWRHARCIHILSDWLHWPVRYRRRLHRGRFTLCQTAFTSARPYFHIHHAATERSCFCRISLPSFPRLDSCDLVASDQPFHSCDTGGSNYCSFGPVTTYEGR